MTSRRSTASPYPQSGASSADASASSNSNVIKTNIVLPGDDEQAAKTIVATKTHYQALFVTKTSTEVEIKASYRKLALRFHPDRCKAPTAEEAFKTISAAYGCLMDTKQRHQYDMQQQLGGGNGASRFSAQQPQPQFQGGANGRTFHFSTGGGGARDDMTAEDLFNMFFFQQSPDPFRQQQRRQQQQQQQQQRDRQQRANRGEGDGDWMQVLHFLPLVIMLLFTMLSFLPSQEAPKYSLERYGRYSVPYSTPYLNVPFFVTTDVHNTLIRDSGLDPSRQRINLGAIHKEVDDEHVEQWKEQCTRSLARKRENSQQVCKEWTRLNEILVTKRDEDKVKSKAQPIKQPGDKK